MVCTDYHKYSHESQSEYKSGVVFSLKTEVFMIDPLISRYGIGNLKSWLGKNGNHQEREKLTLLEIINDQTLFLILLLSCVFIHF